MSYFWLKDKAGNISELSAGGDGTLGTDKQSVVFTPGASIKFTKLAAGNVQNFSSPPLQSEIRFDADNRNLYVRWGYEWINGGKAIESGDPIDISYSLDGLQFISIGTAHEGANGDCVFDVGNHESGCYQWQNIPESFYTPEAKSFFIKVSVKDDSGYIYGIVSHPLNSGSFRVLAGNTTQNIGGDAANAIYNIEGTGLVQTERMIDTSVVDDEGNIYVVDVTLGVLKIDSGTGLVNNYLKRGLSPVDGFLDDPKTTLSNKTKISLSYNPITLNGITIKNPLYILESERVRRIVLRVDTKDNLTKPYLETFIGANGISGNGTIRGTQYDRCIIYDKSLNDPKTKVVTSFTGYPEGSTTQPVYLDFDPRWTCQLSKADIARGYKIYYTATDPEKLNMGTGGGFSGFWNLLPNGNVYFNRSGTGSSAKRFDLRLYKFDSTKKAYRIFPIILSGKGTLRNCQDAQTRFSPESSPNQCEKLLFNPISDLLVSEFGVSFNPLTSLLNTLFVRMQFKDDGINWKFYSSNFNPNSGISNGTIGHYPFINNWISRGTFTSRRGDLYAMQGYTGSLYKSNPSNFSWNRILGNAIGMNEKMCADGTLATNCAVKLQSSYINSENKIFFWDDNKLRAIDQDGNVRSILGQSKSEGENIDPLLARIGDAIYISTWGPENHITFYDRLSKTIREIDQGGAIRTIAGNGSFINKAYTWTTADETTEKATNLNVFYSNDMGWNRDQISVDKTDGTLYTAELTNSKLIKLNRTTGKWNRLFGGPRTVAPTKSFFASGTSSCDNQSLANCLFQTAYGGLYTPHFAGQVPSRVVDGKTYPKQFLILSHMFTLGFHRNCYVKSFSPDLNSIQHFMGNDDNCYSDSLGENHFPTLSLGDKVSIATTSKFPGIGNVTRMVYSNPLDGWFVAEPYAKQILLIKNYRELVDTTKNNQVTKADTIEIAQLVSNGITSFTVIYDNNERPIYIYCSYLGRMYSVKDGVESELPLPSGITCYGKSIETTYDNKKVIFPFQKNGLKGIGEYEIL